MEIKLYHRYIILAVFMLVLFLTYLLVKPYLMASVLAIVFAVLAYPIFEKINWRIKKRKISSILTTLVILVIIFVPLIFVINLVAGELSTAYTGIRQSLDGAELTHLCDNKSTFACNTYNSFMVFVDEYNLRDTLKSGLQFAVTSFSEYTYNALTSVPVFFINLVLFIYLFYTVLINKEYLTNKIKSLFPFDKKHQDNIIKRFSLTVQGVFYGQIITAIIQGIVGMIGLFIFGVPNALVLGIVMIVFAFVPMFGTAIVWFPASLYLIIIGSITDSSGMVLRGVLLLIYGIFIISTIDNFVKPFLIGDKAGLHPFLILISVFGGIALFGVLGIILGPIIMSLFITLLNIYEEETHAK